MSKPTILVVDDSSSFLHSIKEILLTENYQVLCAGDVDSAWNVFQQQQPELVLTDVHLASTDASDQRGIELMKKIHQQQEHNKTCPVILMSSDVSIKAQLKDYQPTTVDFISKPFDPSRLLEKIESRINT